MSLHTVIKPTTRLNEIIKAVAETEPSPVNETIDQYNVSEDTCKEMMADVLQQVLIKVVCYSFATDLYGPDKRDQGYDYVGEARSPKQKTNNIPFAWPRFHQTRADSNHRFC
jgi:hypothetical protein